MATLSKKDIEATIDRSLKRLHLDQLHLVQFHWWDYDVQKYVETALVLQELQKKGKILHIGGTNFDVSHLQEINDAGVDFASLQVQYSLLDNRPEYGLSSYCQKNNIKFICYGTVAGGFLSSQYIGQPEPQYPLSNRSLTKYKLIIDDLGGWEFFQALLSVLNEIAKKHGVSVTNVATRYILEKPNVASIVIGARNTEHLNDNLHSFGFSLDTEDRKKLHTILSQAKKLEGDVYAFERTKGGKHASIMKYNLNKE